MRRNMFWQGRLIAFSLFWLERPHPQSAGTTKSQRRVGTRKRPKKKNHTVRLTSIDHPQIEGKFTATPGGLTNLFYSCKD